MAATEFTHDVRRDASMLDRARLSLAEAERLEGRALERKLDPRHADPIANMRDELLIGILQSNIAVAEALAKTDIPGVVSPLAPHVPIHFGTTAAERGPVSRAEAAEALVDGLIAWAEACAGTCPEGSVEYGLYRQFAEVTRIRKGETL